jgi:hypothetical protein
MNVLVFEKRTPKPLLHHMSMLKNWIAIYVDNAIAVVIDEPATLAGAFVS